MGSIQTDTPKISFVLKDLSPPAANKKGGRRFLDYFDEVYTQLSCQNLSLHGMKHCRHLSRTNDSFRNQNCTYSYNLLYT